MAAETSPELHTVPWALVDVVISSKSITRLDHQSIFLWQTGEVLGHSLIVDVVAQGVYSTAGHPVAGERTSASDAIASPASRAACSRYDRRSSAAVALLLLDLGLVHFEYPH